MRESDTERASERERELERTREKERSALSKNIAMKRETERASERERAREREVGTEQAHGDEGVNICLREKDMCLHLYVITNHMCTPSYTRSKASYTSSLRPWTPVGLRYVLTFHM